VLEARDGAIVTPSGMHYRVLALDPSTQRMSSPVLRKISALVERGATVVGQRPTMTPSLADDEHEFNAIADRLWGGQPPGKGRVLTSSLESAMQQLAVEPDCLTNNVIRCVHRHIESDDLYFVENSTAGAQTLQASFRTTGKAAEIWRAATGQMAPASYRIDGAHTTVPLKLEPYEAVFVVFRQPTSQASRNIPEPVSEVVDRVPGPWTVSFPPDHGAPAQAQFPQLTSWTDSTDPGVKYFSGTATYTTAFTANRGGRPKGARLRLDLGDVKDLAEVTLNGKPLGILWKHPFVVDITAALKVGKNQLEVKVTNVWPNRLIGDKQLGARRIAYATFDPYKADSPLLPSGLLGPVTISQLRTP